MAIDWSRLAPIVARVKTTPASVPADGWIDAALPGAGPEDRRALLDALAARPSQAFNRDPERIRALQNRLKAIGLKAFLVPRADAHQGEYIMARAERLRWLTGFTGSSGFAIVMQDKAALFVDGRYTLQAPAETDATVLECRHFKSPPPADWLAGEIAGGDRVGFDPAITPVREAARWRDALAKAGGELVALDANPIDALWTDQPGDPFSAAVPHPLRFAGRPAGEKLVALGAAVEKAGADVAVLNQLDSIAWTLNVRGADTPNTPLVQSFLIVDASGAARWHVDAAKLTPGLLAGLDARVAVAPFEAFGAGLDALSGRRALIDPETATQWVNDRLVAAGATVVHGADPAVPPKARKNPRELAGTRAAHRRDGAAMVRMLAWFDRAALGLTETEIMDRLESVRGEDPLHRGPSFTTIAGAGPNGAIVHYRAEPGTARRVEKGTLFLLDSGAQYLDGTTDVTRTIPVGAVPRRMKAHFTLVLKGHIAVATARFPKGVGGIAIDGFARRALWAAGLDFDHGTGHGVGVYLGVHEGPGRLSPLSQVPLEPGMILSNEPGYYEAGSHGIRIENLLVVREARAKGFLEFETITLAPIDRRAILPGLLSENERAWVDAYHARVMAEIGPRLDASDRAWLKRMTRPL